MRTGSVVQSLTLSLFACVPNFKTLVCFYSLQGGPPPPKHHLNWDAEDSTGLEMVTVTVDDGHDGIIEPAVMQKVLQTWPSKGDIVFDKVRAAARWSKH